jgi:hypothetical protein
LVRLQPQQFLQRERERGGRGTETDT